MKKVMLVVSYDGTNYCGWQVQPNEDTIEGQLNKAISELTGEDIRVEGASRTDSKVHAMGNVATFETESRIPAEKFADALNTRLPYDIRIVNSVEVKSIFHPRKRVKCKTYEYRILNARRPDPTRRLYTYYYYKELDVEKMKEAAKYFEGEHDFASFCAANGQAKTTVRTIYNADIKKEGDEIIFTVTGSGFLYNMIRIMVGTLIEVGRGKIDSEDIKTIIDKKEREYAGPTAMPQGLKLMSIEYEEC